MAQGSIVWRCRICGNKSSGTCKHPKARYSIVYYVGKRQKWEVISRTKKDAQRRLTEVFGDLYRGTLHAPKPVIFREFAVQWLQYVEGRLRPLTLRSYEQLVRLHLIPAFGDLLLSQVTAEHAQSLMSTCRKEKGLSPRTTNYVLAVLKRMYRYAHQRKLIRENPIQYVSALKYEMQEMEFLTPAEIRLLLQHADEPYRTLFLTAALTGMRMGEILGLQWGDVDWHNNVIRVRRSLFWFHTNRTALVGGSERQWWRFSPPKTRMSIRSVVLSPKVREALEVYKCGSPRSPHDLVFCNQEGGPLVGRRVYEQHFLHTLARAGLRKIRFHDLRHTFASLLVAQGAHVKVISSQLGHTSVTTTMDRYAHLLPGVQDGIGERLDTLVFADNGLAQMTTQAAPC